MLMSMTGFGRGEASDDVRKISVEIKSVNHRYLDVSLRMPKKLNPYEASSRRIIKDYLQRGKVDVFVTIEDTEEGGARPLYHPSVAEEYMKIFEEVRNFFSIEDDMRLSSLVRMPEVITLDSSNDSDEELEQLMVEALKQALSGLVSAREKEGEHLKDDLLAKLDYMLTLVEKIEKRSPTVVEEYRKKLTDKVRELLEENSVDENRILTEVVVFADKICVDEETVRLKAHIENMKKLLIEGGGVGRKLDFVAQEMNREANTTLSKCSDLETSEIAIDLKTEIEKVREQVQNIE